MFGVTMCLKWNNKKNGYYALFVVTRQEIQCFDAICPPSAEQIQRRLIHFLAELGLHQCGQTVYLLAHVRIAAGNIIVLYAAEIKHGRVPSQTPREFLYPCPTETRLPRRSPESRFHRRKTGEIRSQPPAFPVLL